MITQVPLDATLAESLQQSAAQQGASLEEALNQLVQQYLRESRHTQLQAEMERYRAQHRQLLAAYPEQFIGLHEGRVLDHDPEGGVLYARLCRQYHDLPILIVQVTETPEQEYVIRSPRWVEVE